MEHIQVSQLNMAVFAPGVSLVMVLSTIAHLNKHDNENPARALDPVESEEGKTKRKGEQTKVKYVDDSLDDDDDDEDDEDIPLATLGIRRLPKSATIATPVSKRAGSENSVRRPNSYFLAQAIAHISHVWGHCYKESDHLVQAW